jgi:ATP-dependent Clp protease ATP-binding subunit ClpC
MFETYTEEARRAIFYSRYEAGQLGSTYIQSEHLLLGLLRANPIIADTVLRSPGDVEVIRKQVQEQTGSRGKVSTSKDLPLSNESKRILAYTAEEAEGPTGHLFWAFCEKSSALRLNCFANEASELK